MIRSSTHRATIVRAAARVLRDLVCSAHTWETSACRSRSSASSSSGGGSWYTPSFMSCSLRLTVHAPHRGSRAPTRRRESSEEVGGRQTASARPWYSACAVASGHGGVRARPGAPPVALASGTPPRSWGRRTRPATHRTCRRGGEACSTRVNRTMSGQETALPGALAIGRRTRKGGVPGTLGRLPSPGPLAQRGQAPASRQDWLPQRPGLRHNAPRIAQIRGGSPHALSARKQD